MKKDLIKITNMEYSYPGEKKVILQSFSQTVESGEVIGVIGKNGVGKSTLMRLLASIHQPLSGNILIDTIDSQDIKKRREYLLNFYYLAHDKSVSMPNNSSLKDYCSIYSHLYPNYSKKIEEDLIKRFNFEYTENMSKLSTGNRMKGYLIFALATRVPILLIDEVTAVLDPENRADFFDLVAFYKELVVTFIIATNIVEDLTITADRVWFIDKGEVFEKKSEDISSLFKRKIA